MRLSVRRLSWDNVSIHQMLCTGMNSISTNRQQFSREIKISKRKSIEFLGESLCSVHFPHAFRWQSTQIRCNGWSANTEWFWFALLTEKVAEMAQPWFGVTEARARHHIFFISVTSSAFPSHPHSSWALPFHETVFHPCLLSHWIWILILKHPVHCAACNWMIEFPSLICISHFAEKSILSLLLHRYICAWRRQQKHRLDSRRKPVCHKFVVCIPKK